MQPARQAAAGAVVLRFLSIISCASSSRRPSTLLQCCLHGAAGRFVAAAKNNLFYIRTARPIILGAALFRDARLPFLFSSFSFLWLLFAGGEMYPRLREFWEAEFFVQAN